MPSSRSCKNQKGQIAIFIALVFQVLFVFFAMVINIGLLVHQKINLQNSVDLAAYYGAMKQAESMNAIAHINYQIRQSWKLMAFRYNQIGTAGDTKKHPWIHERQMERGSPADDQQVSYAGTFCSGYGGFNPYKGRTENYCKDVADIEMESIKAPVRTNVSGAGMFGLANFMLGVNTATNRLVDAAVQECKNNSSMSWYILARFIAAYREDLINRKTNLIAVANSISGADDKMMDLDGTPVKIGVQKTLINNLTAENKDSLAKFEFVNSLSHPDCGSEQDSFTPPKWLNEIMIAPVFFYVDMKCGDKGSFNPQATAMVDEGQPNVPQNIGNLNIEQSQITYLKNSSGEPPGNPGQERLNKSSLGFEKNPWCMAYVKASATTEPNLPFSPFGKVTLTATAYAKPFGGKIGPWYGKTWNSSSPQSEMVPQTDPLAPTRVGVNDWPPLDTPANKKKNLVVNYSRYPGDAAGIRSQVFTSEYGKSIHNNGPSEYTWWNHLIDDTVSAKGAGDILAWDSANNSAPFMRRLELQAIAPDLFDTYYYSIEPDFYRNYLVRMEKNPSLSGLFPRGDLGSRKNSSDAKLKSFSVKDQINSFAKSSTAPPLDFNRLAFFLNSPFQLLTSWQSKRPDDYTGVDSGRFGKCMEPVDDSDDPSKATAGNCKIGGRTGYSVKLVDEDYLKKPVDVGNTGENPLKNPPK